MRLPRFEKGKIITADDLNRLAAACERATNITGPDMVVDGQGVHIRRPAPPVEGLVTVYNGSGADLGQFNIVGIDETLQNAPSEDADEAFRRGPVFKVITPTADHAGKFVVMQEFCKTGAFGKAKVVGITPVLVMTDSDDAEFADVEANQRGYLTGGSSGAAQILWLEAAGEPGAARWAVVRLGTPSAPGVKYGKATATWTSGNTVTLTPVVSDLDATPTGEPNVVCFIFSPQRGTPANVQISINDVCDYFPIVPAANGTPRGQLANPNFGAFTSLGSAQYQVYQMTTASAAGWDWVRAHA